jgi:hypothetical protein
VWKEVHTEGGLRLHWLARVILSLLVVLSFLPAAHILLEESITGGYFRSAVHWQMNIWVRATGTVVACLLLLAIAVRAAGSVSGERSRQTLDGLLTTRLEMEEIVYGKWFGSLFSVRWGWLWLGLIWLLGIATGGLNVLAVPFLVICGTVYAVFLASLGVWLSVISRTTLRATVATVGAAVGLSFGHWLLWACCIPLGGGPGGDQLIQLQVGLTPPAVLALVAFEGTEFRGASEGGAVVAGIVIGLLLWTGGAAALLNAATVRFKQLVGRVGTADPASPLRKNAEKAGHDDRIT